MGPHRITVAFRHLQVIKDSLETEWDILKAFQRLGHLHSLDLSFGRHLVNSVTEGSQEKESLDQAVKVARHTLVYQTLVLLLL